MDNQEAIETIKLALSQIEWEYPMDYAVAFDMAISALQEQEAKNSTESSLTQKSLDTISRYAAIDALEKCYTCKHVYQRVSDADTLYCRRRKGCRYEEVKPRRSGESPRRHEG